MQMPTLDQFTKQLTDSGLMSVDQLQEFCETLTLEQSSDSAGQLSRQLVESNVLTEYQVNALTSGDSKPLVVGDYVVLEKVGAGGMGVVFKARHRRMKRDVALKMLPHNFSQDDSAIKRFEREVEVAAKLNHPNIVAALDAREENGNHYLIMELVEGRAISTIISEDGTFTVPTAVDYIIQAATGLAHAHQLGVIHRDVKPSNLMLDKDRVVKILDMGLARVDLPTADGFGKTQSELTSAGVIMGTLDYVSPEQAMDSRKVDHRTDIYSLGCTLYYFLVGRPVFCGETPMELLIAHREREIPSLRQSRPDAPVELEEVFQKMVAKHADDRFQSMTEVVAALRSCLGQDVQTIPQAELVEEAIVVVHSEKRDFANSISDAVSQAVSGVVSGVVTGVVAGVKNRKSLPPIQGMYAPVPDQRVPEQRKPEQGMPFHREATERPLVPQWIPQWKLTSMVMTGRLLGIVLGVFAGIGIGGSFGGLAIAVAIVVYVWFGWQWGAGYARMFAYQNGWTHVPPEHLSGTLFQLANLKLHAIAILIGAGIGSWTIGVVGGTFAAVTTLALMHRLRRL